MCWMQRLGLGDLELDLMKLRSGGCPVLDLRGAPCDDVTAATLAAYLPTLTSLQQIVLREDFKLDLGLLCSSADSKLDLRDVDLNVFTVAVLRSVMPRFCSLELDLR